MSFWENKSFHSIWKVHSSTVKQNIWCNIYFIINLTLIYNYILYETGVPVLSAPHNNAHIESKLRKLYWSQNLLIMMRDTFLSFWKLIYTEQKKIKLTHHIFQVMKLHSNNNHLFNSLATFKQIVSRLRKNKKKNLIHSKDQLFKLLWVLTCFMSKHCQFLMDKLVFGGLTLHVWTEQCSGNFTVWGW